MHRLRHARFLARLVLAWFALTVGAAVAAPVLAPQGGQWLCSGGGMTLVAVPDGDAGATQLPTLDCPLCASLAAPPTPGQLLAAPVPTGPVIAVAWRNPVVRPAAAALPPRGPPAST